MTDVFSHSTSAQFSDPELCSTGMAPSARALGAARATLLNAALYKGHGILSIAERPSTGAGGNFYVFYPAVVPADGSGTTRIMIDLRMSNYGSGTTSGAITVYDYLGNELSAVTYSGAMSTATPLGNVDAQGFAWVAYVDAPTTSTDDYQYIQVSVTTGLVVSCVATHVPKPATDLNVSVLRGLGGGNFTAGAPLIGYDRAAPGVSGSVDSLVQPQVTRVGAEDPTWLALSRRCLWGWSTAFGRYYVHPSSSGWAALMSASFRPLVQPRNLRDGGSVSADVCVMYRADTGAKIRITSSAGSVESALTAATTTPAAAYISGLDVSVSDELTVEVYATTTAAIELRALAIFDSAEG